MKEREYDISNEEIEALARYHCEEAHRVKSIPICPVCGLPTDVTSLYEVKAKMEDRDEK